MDKKLGAKVVAKHGANVGVNRDAKLDIKKDETLGANDKAKHGVDMVAK